MAAWVASWKLVHLLVVALLGRLAEGGLVATEDAVGVQNGTVISDNLAVYLHGHLAQNFDSGRFDPTNAVLGFANTKVLSGFCNGSYSGAEANVRGLDIVLFEDADGRFWEGCANGWHDLCDVAPVFVKINRFFFQGYMHFAAVDAGENIPNASCVYLQTDPIDDELLERLDQESVLVNVSIDRSDFVEKVTSIPYVIYGNVIVPIMFWVLGFAAAWTLWKRRKICKKTTYSQLTILVMNAVQGIVLGSLGAARCLHYVSDTCSPSIMDTFWTYLMGLSLCSDILFAIDIEKMISRLVSKPENSPAVTFGRIPKVRKEYIGTVICVLLDLCLACLHLAGAPNEAKLAISYSLVLLQLGTIIYLTKTTRAMSCILLEFAGLFEGQAGPTKADQILLDLAQLYAHCGKLSIFSAFLVQFSSLTFGVAYSRRRVSGYFVYVVSMTVGKLLNMYAQTCALYPWRKNFGSGSVLVVVPSSNRGARTAWQQNACDFEEKQPLG
mmetsp:Transcript_30524/g.48843  ORF Transcript_30524/g.48843 Transcript_30524/m.48843 type:complete len:497 (+) Transcript_30524:983-2473(+)|eukprot:CAMPEP_0203746458 /NCGR_PEP_ID=MMETSP0098-20131031/1901_1 /ASSEMBLY_ACC=CAM_ASM_000208 /TAXON_ID=96639 /ORGANISM=" , Strain NY0313808BC1" /LENGTH=496 /DNA_ID=CAMNT_0050634575 /DNA_START=881 /DNA_END=2371 /DNA_ORIENTATION=+